MIAIPNGYSADVSGRVVVGDREFGLWQIGPEMLILRQPVDLPETEAELIMSIDGNERRSRIMLYEGSLSSRAKVAYRKL